MALSESHPHRRASCSRGRLPHRHCRVAVVDYEGVVTKRLLMKASAALRLDSVVPAECVLVGLQSSNLDGVVLKRCNEKRCVS